MARTAPAPEVPPVEPAVVQPSASPVTEVAVAQPAPPPVTEPPATLVIPPPPTQPRIVVSESFEFATGSAVIPASAIARLDEIAGLLRNDQRTLTIAGHTDNTGDAAVNSELSQRRAEAVLRHLVSRGVPAAQLKARGMGQDQPVADNATAEGRARNRRIEIAE
ncbi:MAG: OmpA family protein [Betaproteobacteria bacterium]|nr:OmpA family protein [Betaproteobacteria bacterium]